MANDYLAKQTKALLDKTKEGLLSDEVQMNAIAKLDDMDAQIERMMQEEMKMQFSAEQMFEDDNVDAMQAAGLAAKNIMDG